MSVDLVGGDVTTADRGSAHKRVTRRGAVVAIVVSLTATLNACGNDNPAFPPPSNSRTPSGLPTAAPTILPTGLPTPTSSPTGSVTFNGNGVTFQYPSNWTATTPAIAPALPGTRAWTQTLGIDAGDFATVAQYTIATSITTANLGQQAAAITTQMQTLYGQLGGFIQGAATSGTMAGFPSLSYTGTAVNPSAQSVKMRFILAFNGTIEYAVTCAAAGVNVPAIDAGCDQIVSTLAV